MRVRAITNYNDFELNRHIKKGEVLEVADARATILADAKKAVFIDQPVKKKSSRKKDEAETE